MMPPQKSLDELINDLRSVRWQEREEAARRLGTTGNPAAIEPLTHALQDSQREVCLAAIDSLVKIGEPAIAPMLNALTAPDSVLRYSATVVLAEIGDPAAVPGLIQAIYDENEDVQVGVIQALEIIGTGEAIDAVEAWRREQLDE